jgi:hypothetical protein
LAGVHIARAIPEVAAGYDFDSADECLRKLWGAMTGNYLATDAAPPSSPSERDAALEALMGDLLSTVHRPAPDTKPDYWHVTAGKHVEFGRIMSALASRSDTVGPEAGE